MESTHGEYWRKSHLHAKHLGLGTPGTQDEEMSAEQWTGEQMA